MKWYNLVFIATIWGCLSSRRISMVHIILLWKLHIPDRLRPTDAFGEHICYQLPFCPVVHVYLVLKLAGYVLYVCDVCRMSSKGRTQCRARIQDKLEKLQRSTPNPDTVKLLALLWQPYLSPYLLLSASL